MVDIRCLDGRLPIGRYVPGVDGEPTSRGRENERARRREARELVAAYHDEQLRALLERVRDGFARLDAGEIDAFDLDDLIHHYKRAARELWKFCGSSGSEWERAARSLAFWREQGEEPEWWEAGAPRHRRNNG
jgi:PAS domain-containing protein